VDVLLHLLIENGVSLDFRPKNMVKCKALFSSSVHQLVVLDSLPKLVLVM
jgi:hypothetical protein